MHQDLSISFQFLLKLVHKINNLKDLKRIIASRPNLQKSPQLFSLLEGLIFYRSYYINKALAILYDLKASILLSDQ